MKTQQATSKILMVRPCGFGFNHETFEDNAFQSKGHIHPDVSKEAQIEFDHMAKTLMDNNVEVTVIDDLPHPLKPDAVFPNNWFSTHHDGTLVIYPMLSEVRRAERDNPGLDFIRNNFVIKNEIHLENFEKENCFLEGTGSIVFDHNAKKAFMCLSKRSDKNLFESTCEKLGYKPISFNAYDENKKEIYHTNVMMSITSKLVIACLESIPEEQEDKFISFLPPNKEILIVDLNQMQNFCCNVLEVKNTKGQSILVMSTRAFQNFNDDQIELIEEHHKIIHCPLTTIENIGGGGARCMMAELFL